MDLRIKGIRYKNIREFNDLEIDLTREDGDTHHISLVQMPNGTGKTTTMDLIRTVLVGKELNEDDGLTVESLEPEEFDAIEGSFEVDFESNGDQFTFRLDLDYETYEYEYRTIRPSEVGGGDMLGHSLPTQLRTVINESFANLFVFNGELTQDFIQTGKDEAENALKTVNYLNRLEDQRNKIEQEVEERQDEDSVNSEKGYRNVKGRLDTAKEKLDELERRESTLKTEIKEHDKAIQSLSTERSEILAENQEQLEKDKRLDREIQELRNDIEDSTDEVLSLMRNPSQLHEDFNDDMEKLVKKMNVIGLPKPTSQEFFTELSERPKCICGREIDEEHAEKILENADHYLSEEDIGVLNLLKEDLRGIPDFEDYEDKFEDLEDKRGDLEQKKQEKGRVDLDDPDMNERLQEITEEKQEEKRNKKQKEEELRKLTSTDKNEREELGLNWKNNIHLCRQKVEERKERVREASNTVNFGKRADILEDIFDDFIDEYLSTLKQNQIDETNQRLQKILGLSQVQIEDIDNSIKIKGKEDVSEGQSLSIAYAYLSTLFEDSAIDVPFIIDSPAVSIDYEKRAEVAPIISDLFDQLVIFVISSERERFVDELDSGDIKYCTVHKTETPGAVEKSLDKEYFMDFQSEEEELEEVA
ncbi:ATP-binding protein [Salarchaeum japonicum]|uniref:Rad50/SbcC-type AAA domain-containing protein n=1 Tax=Salarchaeum japonicum TaxID=555573 RepID=A0AAV3SZJ3_9EURY|nr:ATP-binding protein [Salarchaeum japonicum]